MNKTAKRLPSPRPRNAPSRPRPRVSDQLPNGLVEAATPDSSTRHDGWTPERIRIFLETLASCGVVEDSARAAGMSRRSAYNLRNSEKGRNFHLAWQAAQRIARHSLADEVFSRAVHGTVEIIYRDGVVWGERHRFDNRLTMAVLTNLNNQAVLKDNENAEVQAVARGFDKFVDLVSVGDDKAASEFVEARKPHHNARHIIVKIVQPDHAANAEIERRLGIPAMGRDKDGWQP